MTSTPHDAMQAVRWSSPAVARIIQQAARQAGLTFPENRREITEAAVRRAMAHQGIKDPSAFAERVATDPSACDAVLTELTIGETYFFRDPAQWDLVRRHIVPDLLLSHPDGRGVRAWSAACSSGEEAYTLGIVLRDAGCVDPTIIGTDLCEHRLGRASRAVYTKWSMRGVDALTRQRYFEEVGQYFHLRPEYRNARFRPLNLAETGFGTPGQELSELDVILCRNVLIYIETDVITAIFERLVSALRIGGWLMIAASDPQPSPDLPLDVVVTEAGLLFRKRDPSSARSEAATAQSFSAPERWSPPPPRRRNSTPRGVKVVKRTDPDVPESVQLAQAYRSAQYAKVVSLGQAIVAADRDESSTWVFIVRAHANLGALEHAAQACATGLSRHQSAAELHVLSSVIESQRERFAPAAEAARRALYLDRTLAVAQLALGTALLRVGDMTAADRALRSAERMLSALGPAEIVPASDGATAFDLLSAARAHRALLEQRGTRVG